MMGAKFDTAFGRHRRANTPKWRSFSTFSNGVLSFLSQQIGIDLALLRTVFFRKIKDAHCSDRSYCISVFCVQFLVFELLSILYFTLLNAT